MTPPSGAIRHPELGAPFDAARHSASELLPLIFARGRAAGREEMRTALMQAVSTMQTSHPTPTAA